LSYGSRGRGAAGGAHRAYYVSRTRRCAELAHRRHQSLRVLGRDADLPSRDTVHSWCRNTIPVWSFRLAAAPASMLTAASLSRSDTP